MEMIYLGQDGALQLPCSWLSPHQSSIPLTGEQLVGHNCDVYPRDAAAQAGLHGGAPIHRLPHGRSF